MTVSDLSPVELFSVVVAAGIWLRILDRALRERFTTTGEKIMAFLGFAAAYALPVWVALNAL